MDNENPCGPSMSADTGAIAPDARPSFFDCKRCGHCCQGQGGIVVSGRDLARLCAFMGLTAEAFEQTFGERRGGKLHICAGKDAACVFFKQGEGCAVHGAKPDICRAWPYFRGNLLDAGSLSLSKDFCPGIPASLPHPDFVRQGLALLREENLVGRAGPDEANALQVADLLQRQGRLDVHIRAFSL